ncbi:MAG TPA: ketose 1,6-bisphosphate aldolase [Victivallales bacterium]|nr:ketose 1,6-bisphosphate aldolase [Victivallales bacterium]
MSLVNLKTVLEDAYNRKYAVGAFNIASFEFLQAIRDTAVQHSSPVIFNIAQVHFPFVNLDDFIPSVLDISRRSDVPMVLNLDHGLDMDGVMKAVRHGFTSVMFDGSRFPYEENIRKTAEVVKLCHSLNISVEGELGAVGGDEGGNLEGSADEEFFTNPEQAGDFVKKTGIDALAVAIGNSHGKYKGDPKLDFNRLEQIRNKVQVPLVLHGGSGISEHDFKKAISMGIAKINFYTGMSQTALKSFNSSMKNINERYNEYLDIIGKMKHDVSVTIGEQMKIFSSIGKA